MANLHQVILAKKARLVMSFCVDRHKKVCEIRQCLSRVVTGLS